MNFVGSQVGFTTPLKSFFGMVKIHTHSATPRVKGIAKRLLRRWKVKAKNNIQNLVNDEDVRNAQEMLQRLNPLLNTDEQRSKDMGDIHVQQRKRRRLAATLRTLLRSTNPSASMVKSSGTKKNVFRGEHGGSLPQTASLAVNLPGHKTTTSVVLSVLNRMFDDVPVGTSAMPVITPSTATPDDYVRMGGALAATLGVPDGCLMHAEHVDQYEPGDISMIYKVNEELEDEEERQRRLLKPLTREEIQAKQKGHRQQMREYDERIAAMNRAIKRIAGVSKILGDSGEALQKVDATEVLVSTFNKIQAKLDSFDHQLEGQGIKEALVCVKQGDKEKVLASVEALKGQLATLPQKWSETAPERKQELEAGVALEVELLHHLSELVQEFGDTHLTLTSRSIMDILRRLCEQTEEPRLSVMQTISIFQSPLSSVKEAVDSCADLLALLEEQEEGMIRRKENGKKTWRRQHEAVLTDILQISEQIGQTHALSVSVQNLITSFCSKMTENPLPTDFSVYVQRVQEHTEAKRLLDVEDALGSLRDAVKVARDNYKSMPHPDDAWAVKIQHAKTTVKRLSFFTTLFGSTNFIITPLQIARHLRDFAAVNSSIILDTVPELLDALHATIAANLVGDTVAYCQDLGEALQYSLKMYDDLLKMELGNRSHQLAEVNTLVEKALKVLTGLDTLGALAADPISHLQRLQKQAWVPTWIRRKVGDVLKAFHRFYPEALAAQLGELEEMLAKSKVRRALCSRWLAPRNQRL